MPTYDPSKPVNPDYFKKPTETIEQYKARTPFYGSGTPTPPVTPPNPTPSPNPTSSPPPNQGSSTQGMNDQILANQKAQVDAAQKFNDTVMNIQNSVIPLNPGQLAQVTGLQQEFQSLIDQQKLDNQGAEGTANIRGYQKGSAEYDPQFQIKTIGAIASAGAAKVATLSTKMASAVAALTQAFKDDNISTAKLAYDTLHEAQEEYNKGLQDYVDDTQAAIQEANKMYLEEQKLAAAEQKQLSNAKNDLAKIAKNNNAPAEVIGAIMNAPDLGTAYNAAGNYSAGGTGIVGEYNYAKANGYTGNFSDYQNEDANRKRQIININSGGLTTQENSSFLRITDKYQADPIINSSIKAGQVIALSDQIIADPNNATNQLASLYIFVKNLDPDSAVREGELSLANQTQSYHQQYKNYFDRINKGLVISPDAAVELAKATKKLVGTWQATADKKTQLYKSQAKNSSPHVGNAFNSYIDDYNSSTTVETATGNEEVAKQKIIQAGSSNPEVQAQVTDLLGTGDYSYSEVIQILGL